MSAPVLTEGSVFGPFEIRGRLGRGGMGVVYRAFDRRHHGEVALKLLAEQVEDDSVLGERFRREARAAFELRNPYVVPVHDFGEIDGRLYISMRLIDGQDLSSILADGPLRPDRAVRIVRQAAHALDAAHRANLIHRDVKPSNLLILTDQDDFTYLVDFGIAHLVGKHTVATSLTSTGATIGTLAYMAPERLRGDRPVDGRVDVYALACVLFEMLTGRTPYPQTDQPGLMAAHLFQPVPTVTSLRPDLSPAWDAVIARGMAKDPDERHATAQELARDAQSVLDGVAGHAAHHRPAAPVTEVPPGPPPTRVAPQQQWGMPPPGGVYAAPVPAAAAPPPRRIGGVVAVATGAVAAGIGAAVVWVSSHGTATSSPNVAAGPTPTVSAASTPTPSPTAALPPVQPQSVNDLGLATPLTTVPCTGGYVLIVGSAVDPGAYRTEVQAFLSRFPGSKYLLAEENCSSLRHFMPDGSSIYSVFYGPYGSLGEACAAQQRTGGDSYVKRLDDATPTGLKQSC